MTKQNVIVSNVKSSGISMEITVAVSNSSLFTSTIQKPPPAPGGLITISRKKLLQKLETGVNSGGGRINAWVDSMRASSPTHIKSSPSLYQNEDETSWTVCIFFLVSFFFILSCSIIYICELVNSLGKQLRHPSALSMFEKITAASNGKQIVVFLDYDGTLSPIVEDPDQAFMSTDVRLPIYLLHHTFFNRYSCQTFELFPVFFLNN